MKTMILAALIGLVGLLGQKAHASTDVNVVTSSNVASGVTVASGTVALGGATRIDNWVNGTQGTSTTTLVVNRIDVIWQNLDSTNHIWCGPDANVSTDTTRGFVGLDVAPGAIITEGLLRGQPQYCKAADAAGVNGVRIHVEQWSKENPY